MSTDVSIPKLGFTMEEGTLVEWLVSDGDKVTEGQNIYVLETEKSNVEIEAPASGTIQRVGEPGAVYKVGQVVGRID